MYMHSTHIPKVVSPPVTPWVLVRESFPPNRFPSILELFVGILLKIAQFLNPLSCWSIDLLIRHVSEMTWRHQSAFFFPTTFFISRISLPISLQHIQRSAGERVGIAWKDVRLQIFFKRPTRSSSSRQLQ